MDRLENTVRPYAWGSPTAIPALLGAEPTGEPQAELWMGAHPGDPSRVDRGQGVRTLADLISADPQAELGTAAVAKFGPQLPFLLKVLAAGLPLSIQAHPTLDQARAGYAAEDALGVPLQAAHRNYKDANHKPELICALDDFEGLCGFRHPAEAADLMASLDAPALQPVIDLLRTKPEEEALREGLATILTMTGETASEATAQVGAALARRAGDSAELAAYAFAAQHFPGDLGLLAMLLLNHVRLTPGEALYLGAGVPHAYLRGTGVEIMANSDNVLRCGLTPKHIDVPEILKVVEFQAARPDVLRPEADADGERLYPVPIDEFRLSRYDLAAESRLIDRRAPQILLCTQGSARLTDADGSTLTLAQGQSAYLPAADGAVSLTATAATVFRATVTL